MGGATCTGFLFAYENRVHIYFLVVNSALSAELAKKKIFPAEKHAALKKRKGREKKKNQNSSGCGEGRPAPSGFGYAFACHVYAVQSLSLRPLCVGHAVALPHTALEIPVWQGYAVMSLSSTMEAAAWQGLCTNITALRVEIPVRQPVQVADRVSPSVFVSPSSCSANADDVLKSGLCVLDVVPLAAPPPPLQSPPLASPPPLGGTVTWPKTA